MSELFLPSALARLRSAVVDAARKDFVGKRLGDVSSPFLVVDLDVLERNMTLMQSFCTANRLLLRPHAKLHKSRAFGAMQLEHGAVGMCVQKVSEAEQLCGMLDGASESGAAAAVRNLFISNEVIGAAKLRRVAKLAAYLHSGLDPASSRNTDDRYLAIAVDSASGVEQLAAMLRSERTFIHVLIEVNVGQNRGGCSPDLVGLAPVCAAIQAGCDVLVFGGLHAYHGGAQHIRTVEERERTIAHSVQLAQQAKNIVESLGLVVGIVTGAGTGTFFMHNANGLYGEVQPGSYLVMDRDYGENSVASATLSQRLTFEHALFLQCTVASCITDATGTRMVLDGGHKSAAIDCGGPAVAPFCFASDGNTTDEIPYVVADNGGDDHCILRLSNLNLVPRGASVVGPTTALELERLLRQRYGRVGETMWLVPGHCDPTFNLHDYVVCVRGLCAASNPRDVVVEDVVAVDGRGCQQ
jgi:D-serine deaminase-like pyridoxal phosphate-dependent protein